jgi:hypothetical protein
MLLLFNVQATVLVQIFLLIFHLISRVLYHIRCTDTNINSYLIDQTSANDEIIYTYIQSRLIYVSIVIYFFMFVKVIPWMLPHKLFVGKIYQLW